jgi:hypothetical protein
MVQAVVCRHGALNLNPSPIKKKKFSLRKYKILQSAFPTRTVIKEIFLSARTVAHVAAMLLVPLGVLHPGESLQLSS